MKRLTVEEFISRAKNLYGDKYDYSKVEYKNTETKVCIICPEHGEWWVTPHNFFYGHVCPTCSGRQRRTKEVFIERALKKHGKRYDYSKVDYKGAEIPVCIICPIHGEFWQKPVYHMNGNGCPACFATPKSTAEEFIQKARDIYGDTYDYSRVDYQGNKTKVCIICPEHGEWWVTPNNFLRGSRCPGCFGTPKYTREEFISKAKEIHGDKYDYSLVEYDGLQRKTKIICPIHGEFFQTAGSHIQGSGCPACSNKWTYRPRDAPNNTSSSKRITRDLFVSISRESHTTKYDYSKTFLFKGSEKVCIICPVHGEFWQTASYHMHGGNCPKCVGGVKLTRESFIEKANAVHKGKYDYSKVEYKNYSTKVCIVCPKHGEFWQTPNNHLFGAGCPTCPQSNLEGELRQFLIKNGIVFEQERGFDWLRHKKKLFLDFYLPDYRVAIECQGKQHFVPIDLFGGEEFFEKTLERDRIKHDLCEKHGIDLLYFSNAAIDYPYPVIENYGSLLDEIVRHRKLTNTT